MPKDAYIRTRIDSYLKEQAELVFSRLGLNMTDAINIFLAQVALRNGLPFEVAVPDNDVLFHQTKEAILKERNAQINAAIQEGVQAIQEGKFLSPEASRKRTRARIDSWQAAQNTDG